ncbi:hypothetical protein C1I98_39770, partial [Spongiactinospora gelatinilytica]
TAGSAPAAEAPKAADPAAGAEAAEPAEAPEAAQAVPAAPRPSLIGDVVIFNDEIVEPVSLPVTTCGGIVAVLSRQKQSCDGASRVSDDDA